MFTVQIIIAQSISWDINHNKDGKLLYLTNCIRLLAASNSITWHVSSQHLLRLGCPLLGYLQLLLPKWSQRFPATLRFPACTCESPSLFLTVSLSRSDLQQQQQVCLCSDLPTRAVNTQPSSLSSNSALCVSPFLSLPPPSSSSSPSLPPSHPALPLTASLSLAQSGFVT